MVDVIEYFGCAEEVIAELRDRGFKSKRNVETHICDHLQSALAVLKYCTLYNKDMRQVYRTVLAAIAPTKVNARDQSGWAHLYEQRLDIPRDTQDFHLGPKRANG